VVGVFLRFLCLFSSLFFFFFQAEDGIRDFHVTGVQTCALPISSQAPEGVVRDAGAPGFLHGLWHGFIFPFAWIGSLFSPEIAVYAVPNNGGWYDFGFFLGVTVLGGGSHFSASKAKR